MQLFVFLLLGEPHSQPELLPALAQLDELALLNLKVIVEERRQRKMDAIKLEFDAINAWRDVRANKANATELRHEIKRAGRR